MTSTAAPRETLTREAVVAAARAMIVSEGLDAVSLRRIGAALGVTAPALYAYVADKRDLLRGVAEHEFGVLMERFEQVDDPDPLVRIRSYAVAYLDYAREQPELYKTMFLFPPDLGMGAPTGQELPVATRTFERGLEAIAEAIASGVLRPELDPLLAGLTLWTATHGLADVLLLGFEFDETGRTLLVDTVLDTVINGLRA